MSVAQPSRSLSPLPRPAAEDAERITALGRMVAGLAHELRNPLAAVQALADSLLVELAPDDRRVEYATRILTAVDRMESFVRAAVRFAQPVAPSAVRLDVAELLPDALRLAGLVAPVSVAPHGARTGELYCRADRAQIVDCLGALLTNARQAAQEPGSVQLRTQRRLDENGDAWIQIEVIDDGAGIPADLLGRVFEPFFSTKPAAIGMGLALAQCLAAQNAGRLEVSSSLGSGSTFTLWLPEASA